MAIVFPISADGEQPDPEISFGIDNYPVSGGGFNEFLPTSKVLGVSQRIPNWSLRAANVEEQRILRERTRLEAEWVLRRLEARLIAALAELSSVSTQIELLLEQKLLLDQEAVYWDGRLASGDNVFDERSEVDVDIAALTVRRAGLETARATLLATITELTAREIIGTVELPELLRRPWDGSTGMLYPIEISRIDVRAAEARVRQRDAAFEPDFRVSMPYKQRESGEKFSGDDWVSFRLGLTVPLWADENQRPKLRAAKAEQSRARSLAQLSERQWKATLTSLASSIVEAGRTLEGLRDQFDAINQKAQALTTAYEAGTAPLDAIIFAQLTALEVEARLVETESRRDGLIAKFNSVFVHAMQGQGMSP